MKSATPLILAILAATVIAAGAEHGPLTVSGTVTVSGTNLPIPGATVRIARTSLIANTDSSGSFVIIDAPAGPQALIASAPGYLSTQVFPCILSYKATRAHIELTKKVSEPSMPRWFASLHVKRSDTVQGYNITNGLAPTLGLDVGWTVFAATSSGLMVGLEFMPRSHFIKNNNSRVESS